MQAHHILNEVKTLNGVELDHDEAEEIKYELYCKLGGVTGEEAELMSVSGLANIIAKCSDTAVYLGKKRFVDLDDMKVLLFDILYNEVYITNGDVIIRISGLPDEILEGVRNDLPAYDYIGERFIPNPLAYSADDLAKVLAQDYLTSKVITLPTALILERMSRRCPSAMERRNMFAVIDVGYSSFEGTITIPGFALARNGMRFWELPDGRTVLVDKRSKIGNEFIETNIPYVGFPVSVNNAQIMVNVYKKFEETTTIGLYSTGPRMSDDIHPYDLALYSSDNIIKFPLVGVGGRFNTTEQKIQEYLNFIPITIEAEYLYETLLLYSSFGFEFVNMLVKSHALPVKFEGLRNISDQPAIEAVIAIVEVGNDGRECEEILSANNR
jgi:hypothetical protein